MRRSWMRIVMTLAVMLILACALMLAGCSTGGGGSDPYGAAYTYAYDQVDVDTGLVLKANGGEDYSFIPFEAMVEEYIDLERCMTNSGTPGPTVQFINFDSNDQYAFAPLKYALYYYAIQTAFIDTAIEDRPQRNAISDREFLRHEYGHHVLYLNGLDDSHSNPLFEQCDALGPKTCNGEYCE
jgi:hypothetical protein